MPRYFLKSTTITEAKPIWDYIRNPEERIGIANEIFRKASEFMSFIRKNFEANEFLHYIHPETKVPDSWMRNNQWSGEGLDLPHKGIYPVPTITCMGVGAASQGWFGR